MTCGNKEYFFRKEYCVKASLLRFNGLCSILRFNGPKLLNIDVQRNRCVGSMERRLVKRARVEIENIESARRVGSQQRNCYLSAQQQQQQLRKLGTLLCYLDNLTIPASFNTQPV